MNCTRDDGREFQVRRTPVVAITVGLALILGSFTGCRGAAQQSDRAVPVSPVAVPTSAQPSSPAPEPSAPAPVATTVIIQLPANPAPVQVQAPVPAQANVGVRTYAGGKLSFDLATTFDQYFSAINRRDFATAWSMLTPNEQALNGSYGNYVQGLSSSSISSVALLTGGYGYGGRVNASVSFVSQQPGYQGVNPGETCTAWSNTYSLITYDGTRYLIDGVPAVQHNAC